MRVFLAAAAIVVVAVISDRSAAAQQSAASPFVGITDLDCMFPLTSGGTWVDGEPRIDGVGGSSLSFQIGNLDPQGGSARVSIGATGADVTVRAVGANLHLIDQRAESIAVTTVMGNGNGGTFRAVHTRSEYHAYNGPGFIATPKAEQLYGSCTVARR